MRVSTRVPTTAQLRGHEAAWIEMCHGDWGLVLMEIAGRQLAEQAVSMWRDGQGDVVVVCGTGNNGGDGMVVARYLKIWGVPVSVFALERKAQAGDQSRNESAINLAVVEKVGLEIQTISESDLPELQRALDGASLVVDALLGTGLDRKVTGTAADVIDLINRSGKAVLSADLPSGINSDTGQVMGIAVRADATVTMGYLKAGLLHYPGAALCGKVSLVDIGLPGFERFRVPADDRPGWWLSTAEWVRSRLPNRAPDAHKGDAGHLLTIAGSAGMSGASLLAAMSALKAGAGLSILATPKSLVGRLPAQEVIYRGIAETPEGSISLDAVKDVTAMLDGFTAAILGPGLSLHPETVKFVQACLDVIDCPCVIDADALNAIARDPGVFPANASSFIITPHPKELSRLIGLSVPEIQADRAAAATTAAKRFGCTVILKGARTVIAGPEENLHINPSGNAGMATAGSGDVLSGIVGGLLAQGLAPFDAAAAGVYIHGAAGDLAAREIGPVGIVAGDVMGFVPTVLGQLDSGELCGSEFEMELFGLSEENEA